VVLACQPDIVEQALRAVEGRSLNTAALIGLIGRGPRAWEGLLADTRYDTALARLPSSKGTA
jgi:beta-N-acetylhexosaminidase